MTTPPGSWASKSKSIFAPGLLADERSWWFQIIKTACFFVCKRQTEEACVRDKGLQLSSTFDKNTSLRLISWGSCQTLSSIANTSETWRLQWLGDRADHAGSTTAKPEKSVYRQDRHLRRRKQMHLNEVPPYRHPRWRRDFWRWTHDVSLIAIAFCTVHS